MSKKIVIFGVMIIAAMAGLLCVPDHSNAAPVGSPQCTGPGQNPSVYGRCLTKGYLSGQPNTDARTAIDPQGKQYQYIPEFFPVKNTYNYDDDWVTGTNFWAFPAVTRAGVYTLTDGTVIRYAGGPLTKNNAYAKLFIAEVKAYLNADFSATGPNKCNENGPSYTPPARSYAPAGYNENSPANATSLNYYLGRADDANGVSHGSKCWELRRGAVGAAVLIATMMGKQGTDFTSYRDGIPYAKGDFANWEKLMLQYDAEGLVNWNQSTTAPPHHLNTTGINYGKDNEFFEWDDSSYRTREIVFTNPSDPAHPYRINRECGNLIGVAKGLAGFDLQPDVKATANYVPQGKPASFQFTVTNDGILDSPAVPWKIVYSPTVPGGGAGSKVFRVGANDMGTNNVDTKNIAVGTKICATITVGPPAAYDYSGDRSKTACTTVVAEPYFSVTGGDVSAGAGMATPGGTDCAEIKTNANAGIVSWNEEADGGYAGAGTQFAALAMNYLQDFVTGQQSSLKPDGLSFANVTDAGAPFTTVGQGIYGGKFGGSACVPNYFVNNAQTISAPSGYELLQSSTQINKAGVRDGAGNLAVTNGTHTTMYVDGNVYIRHNITFSGNYANIGDIPSFTVVARGNIYIDPDVTQLDGVYVAEPKTAIAGGNIYTCAPARNFTTPLLNTSLYSACDNRPLQFNGAVVAKQLWLLRTAGSLYKQPAETFNYTPEIWLTSPFAIDTTGKAGNYQAITSLPPVL